jgi:hypothetical protein
MGVPWAGSRQSALKAPLGLSQCQPDTQHRKKGLCESRLSAWSRQKGRTAGQKRHQGALCGAAPNARFTRRSTNPDGPRSTRNQGHHTPRPAHSTNGSEANQPPLSHSSSNLRRFGAGPRTAGEAKCHGSAHRGPRGRRFRKQKGKAIAEGQRSLG